MDIILLAKFSLINTNKNSQRSPTIYTDILRNSLHLPKINYQFGISHGRCKKKTFRNSQQDFQEVFRIITAQLHHPPKRLESRLKQKTHSTTRADAHTKSGALRDTVSTACKPIDQQSNITFPPQPDNSSARHEPGWKETPRTLTVCAAARTASDWSHPSETETTTSAPLLH